MHRDLDVQQDGEARTLGAERWIPSEPAAGLGERLRAALDHPMIVELVLFGSQARGATTGFSDVDALLVIRDDAADDGAGLHALRPHVLTAQRAVLAYQPMQHHGFEVTTPKLLRSASNALALPASALADTSSLMGRPVSASLSDAYGRDAGPFRALVDALSRLRSWPTHPWDAHVKLAMFELLPTLYLQARGASVPKNVSFEEARTEFGAAWWPYDALNELRLTWPRTPRPRLELGASIARNPWTAVAAWRRLTQGLPAPTCQLLTPRLLDGLRSLAGTMTGRLA